LLPPPLVASLQGQEFARLIGQSLQLLHLLGLLWRECLQVDPAQIQLQLGQTLLHLRQC
jgi:hypothetical protein